MCVLSVTLKIEVWNHEDNYLTASEYADSDFINALHMGLPF